MAPRTAWPDLKSIHTIAFDFDGVFTDNKVYVAEDGTEIVRCDRADGLGIDLLRAARARGLIDAAVFILSKEKNPVVEARARKLRLACHHGYDDKLKFMTAHLSMTRPDDIHPFAGLVFVGNDVNDLDIMVRAGFSVAPSDAHPRVRDAASTVLSERGGDGFVRAFIERLLQIQNMAAEDLHELIHHR